MLMTFRFSKNSIEKLKGVHPALLLVISRALLYSPTDFSIVQGVRTQAYQDDLYAQGRTKPGNIVTQTRDSRHIGGYAIDFACLKDGAINWDTSLYVPVASAFKKASLELNIPIVCGADWKFADFGHIELDATFYPKET